ncbi:glutamic-type intramembrane protease PrsW [Paenibacillus sp. GCM10023248]|uniref:glutamic-type intramembrane protease PrsW n=1 Tax=Bacillales TaxID=1385 RepID=UPI00237850E8|nr:MULTISPECIES: glutamic-type intramembrane protease PrsW [Bacillales]MDD9267609.1 glutamic-type intramembrane protease PrsW [Paenibacillus sp. MAHUQ-63]MDR6884421.1 RsiW-degrading membrane proteinase PrsW (M82 family) [Bacillus sp. 3255]
MQALPIILAAIAPGLSLLAYFYLKDRYETEPIHLVIRMFVFGVLLVYPTMVLQRALIEEFGEGTFISSFLLSGGVEEFLKWFVLYHLIFRHEAFDEPYDGIVYAVAVSLGYATLENIIYAFLHATSFSALMIRALLPVSAHALFGVMMGYYLGKAKFVPHKARRYLWFSLLLPIFWHGLFDYILLLFTQNWVWAIIPVMAFLWIRTIWRVDRANAHSPLRIASRDDKIKVSKSGQY